MVKVGANFFFYARGRTCKGRGGLAIGRINHNQEKGVNED